MEVVNGRIYGVDEADLRVSDPVLATNAPAAPTSSSSSEKNGDAQFALA